MKEDRETGTNDCSMMETPMTRRSLLKGTMTIAGATLALSVFGGATPNDPEGTHRNGNESPTANSEKSLNYVTEDNYWLGGY